MRNLVAIEKTGTHSTVWRAYGLKRTKRREVVLSLLRDAQREERHVDAETLYRHAVLADEPISLSTVYRVLAEFKQAGLAQAHTFLGMRTVYELESGQSRDHLVNLDTSQISHLPSDAMEPCCAALARARGVVVVQRNVTLYVREGQAGNVSSLPTRRAESARTDTMMRKAIRESIR